MQRPYWTNPEALIRPTTPYTETVPLENAFRRMLSPFTENLDVDRATYPMDMEETDEKILVDAELPGFKPEEVNVSIEDNTLHITAERHTETNGGKKHLSERRYTHMERRLSLPKTVDEGHVDAKLKDGVLHLEMMKNQKQQPKQIEIK
jgi:HSP20 family protein